MSLTHKSQSALEYMMTYGWAILIIVIVAAVLYSLGIFSPSSSITSSVTGFSNLGSVIAQVIPNSGLMLSLGDSAGYNINITNITISLNGKTSTIEPNTLISSSSSSKFFIPFSSVSASSSYSFAVTVHYTEPGQALPGPYISKGTVYGTATGSSGFYQSITITNSQTTPTPAPFQQMINLSSSNGAWYTVTNMIASNYQNVEFFSSNGTIIPSWLENYSSSQFIYWIKLQNGIPASSSVTIYMVYLPKSDNVLNSVNDGEAPQIPCGSTPTSSCSNYAEYDDGANIFNNYWNFAGTSLPSGWINNGGVTATINNGLTLSYGTSAPPAGWSSSGITYQNLNLHNLNNIVESRLSFNSITEYARGILFITSNATNAYSISSTTYAAVLSNPTYYAVYQQTADSGASGIGTQQFSAEKYAIAGVVNVASANKISFTYNYNNITLLTQAGSVNSYYLALGFGESSDPSISVTWIRVRAYPPNGVMPSVSFGSVS